MYSIVVQPIYYVETLFSPLGPLVTCALCHIQEWTLGVRHTMCITLLMAYQVPADSQPILRLDPMPCISGTGGS
jgi:hypothetical protein